MSNLLVTGSIAYDRISVFKDHFGNHILPGHVHNLNVAFMVDELEINYGGTGANIAYNLGILGQKPILVGALGSDSLNYLTHLKRKKINTTYIKRFPNTFTATATIMTDLDDNQITSFHMGAMKKAHQLKLKDVKEAIELAIISPNNIKAMSHYADYCFEKEIPFISDPGQSITAFSKEDLTDLITGAHVLIANDYEWEMILKKTGLKLKDVLDRVNYIIITYGEFGSKIWSQDATVFIVPAYKPNEIVDPTGSGDAYRAGLMYGIKHDYSIEQSAHIGAWLAAKAIEKQGTQNHKVNKKEFNAFLKKLK